MAQKPVYSDRFCWNLVFMGSPYTFYSEWTEKGFMLFLLLFQYLIPTTAVCGHWSQPEVPSQWIYK
jgi:hypothetical protein